MTRNILVAGLGLFLVLAVLHLGMKVHVLEDRIRALEKSGNAVKVVPLQAGTTVPQRPVFGKVNRAADDNDSVIVELPIDPNSRSKVGVPWEIDRGMLYDSIQPETQNGNYVPATRPKILPGATIEGVLQLDEDTSIWRISPPNHNSTGSDGK